MKEEGEDVNGTVDIRSGLIVGEGGIGPLLPGGGPNVDGGEREVMFTLKFVFRMNEFEFYLLELVDEICDEHSSILKKTYEHRWETEYCIRDSSWSVSSSTDRR